MERKRDGLTILVNIDNADQQILQSESLIRHAILEMCKILHMTPVLESMQIYKFPVLLYNKNDQYNIYQPYDIKIEYKGDTGYSGGIIILESHIYFHSWFEEKFMRLEISTCKIPSQNDIIILIDFLKNIFKTNDISFDLVNWRKYYQNYYT